MYAAAVTEVELDVLTGQTQINRVDMLYDCGERSGFMSSVILCLPVKLSLKKHSVML